MRGDQLVRLWLVLRGIEASPNGLTAGDLASREETGKRIINENLEALQAAGFPQYTERVEKANRWAFIDTFKFRTPSLFTFYSVLPQNDIFTESRTAAWATTT